MNLSTINEELLNKQPEPVQDGSSFPGIDDARITRAENVGLVLPTAILTTDRDLNITHWNGTAETMFGWPAQEVIGKSAPVKVRAKILEPITSNNVFQSLAKKGSWAGEVSNPCKDNSTLKTLTSVGVIWDDAGDFNGLIAVHQQLPSATSNGMLRILPSPEITKTAIKSRTEELVETNGILQQELNIHKQAFRLAKESEGRNRDLVDNIKLGIFRCTPGSSGRFLEVNKAMEGITGYSRLELLSINVCDLYPQTEPGNPFTNDVEIADWKVTRELALRRKDGRELTTAVTIVAIRFESGAIQFFDGILEDVSESKLAQEQVQQSLHRLQKTIREIIEAMAYIGEVRDPATAGHQRRVAQLSFEIAKTMGLAEEKNESLTMAAFVHDIGKIMVPADILSKPGKLTKPEFDMLKDHTRVGYEILKTVEFPWPIATIVLQHHERINGSGYPAGLSGDQIILESKILAVADVVEAMSSHRPYRPALGIDRALEEISQNRGTLYDAGVVDACITLFKDKGFSLS
ncbi:MAG TPA: HD domain-containing phosphohydrolase [Dehalococcoidales bacterium]